MLIKVKFQEFYDHCYKSWHYFFQIKKCDETNCNICKPLKSDRIDFSQVYSLSDLVLDVNKISYKQFLEVYENITTE